ncbi:hypothetical protein N0S44_000269 [Escherichia coli]|nr:hypothetical protein [Escherichia coli]EJR1979114.1 hypothetical protein [Escherichia coli]
MDINELLNLLFNRELRDTRTIEYQDVIRIETDFCYGKTTHDLLNPSGKRYADVCFSERSDGSEITSTEIVFYDRSSAGSYEIELIYCPCSETHNKRQILYDVYSPPGIAEYFVIDYSTEESVFQQSLIYNFQLNDPLVPKIFKLLDTIDVEFEFVMCIRTSLFNEFVELFNI